MYLWHTRGDGKGSLPPVFAAQYEALCLNSEAIEIAGELTALLTALEVHGHDIEGEQPGDASHPIVVSRYRMFALRRTPHTEHTPYADSPPVIRMPYVWFHDINNGEEVAVVMLVGDKTQLGSLWYPNKVKEIETRMIPDWERKNPTQRARRRA